MTVVSWDLFEDMRDAQEEQLRLNRLRPQGLSQHGHYYYGGGGTAKTAWAPGLDITERKDAYLVTVELPGVGIGDLEITFQDGLLTIQGERHDPHHSSEEKIHRVERRYGPFLRSITLPTHVMADAIEASTHDGVLQILVAKAPEVQAKRIHVSAGQIHADPAPAIEGETSN